MLAVNSKEYELPAKQVNNDQVIWVLESRKHDGEMLLVEQPFNFTLMFNGGKRLTFTYDAASVRPAGRTLRVYGSDTCGRFTKYLAQNLVSDKASYEDFMAWLKQAAG